MKAGVFVRTQQQRQSMKTASGSRASSGLTLLLYILFVVVITSSYLYLSDKRWSFLLTLGGLIRCFSFTLLSIKGGLFYGKPQKSISPKSLQLYACVFLARSVSVLLDEVYKPNCRSGDWLYPLTEGLSLCLVLYAVLCTSSFTAHDQFGNRLSGKYGAICLVVPCLVIAAYCHPTLSKMVVLDVLWSFALYLESCAALPQLLLFQEFSRSKPVDAWTSHFVATIGIAQVVNTMFWVTTHTELSSSLWVGWSVLVAQIIQVLVLGKFWVHYLYALSTGVSLVLYSGDEFV